MKAINLICGMFVLVLTFAFAGAHELTVSGKNTLGNNVLSEIEGEVEIIGIDDFEGVHFDTRFYINNEKGTTEVHFGEGDVLRSGDLVRATGYFDEEHFVAMDYEILESGSSLRDLGVIGEQSVLVVLVNFQNNPIEPITVAEADTKMFDESHYGSPDSWYREVSYGRTWIAGDVIDWVTLPYDQSNTYCDLGALRSAVVPIIDAEVDFREYRAVSIVFPYNTCAFGGIANVGTYPYNTGDGRVEISFNAINGVEGIDNGVEAHEFGHNVGLWHANDLECGSVALATNCQSVEYGDVFDTMGIAQARGHFNVVKKELLGWTYPNEIITNPSAGIYNLTPIEYSGGTKALKFSLTSGKKLYAEYRRPTGYDSSYASYFGGHLLDGLLLHTNHFMSWGESQLVDTTPGSNSTSQFYDSLDGAVKVGDVFDNPANGIYFKTLELTDDYAKVRVGRPVCGDGILDVDLGEECDGRDFGETICTDVGLNGIFYDGGQLSCRSDCTFDTNQCTIRESCKWDQDGNGIVEPSDRGFVSAMIGCSVGRGNPLCDLADVNDDGFVNPGDRGFISANLGACSA